MASNPLVQAVSHFSLAQLMADANLCRNVLNDVGAPPAEIFVLVAALEARIPQTLIEHSATNDLSVVGPRLVAELNDRGIDLNRAQWAVDAWQEVVAGSALGQPTVRPSEPATVRPASVERPAAAAAPVVAGRPAEGAVVSDRLVHTPTTPAPRGGANRSKAIFAAVIAVLVAVVVVLVVTRPSSKHGAPSANSSGRNTTASSGASSPRQSTNSSPSTSTTGSAAATGNLAAPLGAPKTVSVPATVSWTNTGLDVTKGERINITASGEISPGGGLMCTADGLPGAQYNTASLVGGGHHAALIGVITSSDQVFLVGANYNGLAPAAGRLFLGINDLGVNNNSGQYTATVRVQS
jgi:hypothetical protein